jgi:hypothetical protein
MFYAASDNMDRVLFQDRVLRGRKLQEAEETYSLRSFIN